MAEFKHLPIIVFGVGFVSLAAVAEKYLKNDVIIFLETKKSTQLEESSLLSNLPKIVLINDRNEESLFLDLPHTEKQSQFFLFKKKITKTLIRRISNRKYHLSLARLSRQKNNQIISRDVISRFFFCLNLQQV